MWGEKVKAGTDGEDGEGQMLGRKRQTRRKRERGRQTERETERDGLKMDSKSLNVVTKTSAAFYVPIQSVLVFFFFCLCVCVNACLCIMDLAMSAISCFQACRVWHESYSHFICVLH